jgi:hypothetical protein
LLFDAVLHVARAQYVIGKAIRLGGGIYPARGVKPRRRANEVRLAAKIAA